MNQDKNIRNMPQKVFAISTRKNGKNIFLNLKNKIFKCKKIMLQPGFEPETFIVVE
jgi:hypothetical protein